MLLGAGVFVFFLTIVEKCVTTLVVLLVRGCRRIKVLTKRHLVNKSFGIYNVTGDGIFF